MTLSYGFTVANVASLLLTALAGYTDNSASSAAGSSWNVAATASVFSNQKKFMPKDTTQAVELLRFVTAYAEGFEALVDITPYSSLLRSAADTDAELSFFAFIDTWVGNNTREAHHIMSLDAEGKCSPKDRMQEAWGGGGQEGNGWGIQADLVFWPRTGFVDTRPRESMTISSGFYGKYSIGGITTHEGTVTEGGDAIELNEAADFTGTLDAEVYQCPGGGQDVELGYKMGQFAQQVLQRPGDHESITKEVYDKLAGNAVTVLSAENEIEGQPHQVEVTFDQKQVQLTIGMAAWYEKEDISVENDTATPGQFPGNKIGSVIRVDGNKAIIEISGPCVPRKATSWLPRLKVEKHRGALARAKKLAQSLQNIGEQQQQQQQQQQQKENRPRTYKDAVVDNHAERVSQADDPEVFRPYLVGPNQDDIFEELRILGRVNLDLLRGLGNVAPPMLFLETHSFAQSNYSGGAYPAQLHPAYPQPESAEDHLRQAMAEAASSKTSSLSDGEKVCILARRSMGRLFERTFNIPTFFPYGSTKPVGSSVHPAGADPADHVLLQFTSTGHGWSGSTEQCGEFCHAIYHINVNGESAAKVTEWRECSRNPVNAQSGTWMSARDGWCPGSVEPGLYIDVTKFLTNDANTISIDLSVWSGTDNKYEKYTNYGNYISGGDNAMLDIGATLFIYDGAAVEAIKQQPKAYTAAEKALREGSSAHKRLTPPDEVMRRYGREIDSTFARAAPSTPESTDASLLSAFLQLNERTEAQPMSNAARAAGLQQPTAFSHVVKSDSSEVKSDSLEEAQVLEPAPEWRTLGAGRNTRNLRGRRQPLSLLAQGTESRYNFEESKAPWYAFDSTKPEDTRWLEGAQIVPAFTSDNGNIQINSREIRATVVRKNIPEEWGYAAVRLKLGAPKGKGMRKDNWDRVGSLGIVFKEDAASTMDPTFSRVKLHPSTGSPRLQTHWELVQQHR